MRKYLLMNMAIMVQDKWFLPFEQYEVLREENIALIYHETRSNWRLKPTGSVQKHYVIDREGMEFILPEEVGVLVDFEIPKDWINRNRLWFEKTTDNIRDYIKAAKEYLNIDIRFRPETAKWYRDSKNIKPKPQIKRGAVVPKDTEVDVEK